MAEEISMADEIEAAAAEPPPAEASSPSPPDSTEQPGAAPTSPPVTEPAVVDDHGPIPFERHEAILGKARREGTERYEKLAWAANYDRTQVDEDARIAHVFRNDPAALVAHLQAGLQQPEPPASTYAAEDGTPLYSVDQSIAMATQIADQRTAAQAAKYEQRLAPLEQALRYGQDHESASAQLEEAVQWTGFRDHSEAIADALEAARESGRPIGVREAYHNVVIPILAADRKKVEVELRKKIVAEMNQTAQTNTQTLNPARTPAATPQKDSEKSMADILRETHADLERRAS